MVNDDDNEAVTDWRDSRSRPGFETELSETLGLVSVSCENLNLVLSRSRLALFKMSSLVLSQSRLYFSSKVSSRSRLGC